MATERKQKKTPKTETLTIRMDPKMRFALEFIARINGQTITKVIERAVLEKADGMKIEKTGNGASKTSVTWKDYWDIHEAVRTIYLARDPDTHPTFDEEEILDFFETHGLYFFHDANMEHIRRECLEVIWPLMPQLLEEWRKTKSSNRRIVEEKIERALKDAGIANPSAF